MASTSNKNTRGDYCLQQQIFERNMDYNLYQHSQHGSSYQVLFLINVLVFLSFQ